MDVNYYLNKTCNRSSEAENASVRTLLVPNSGDTMGTPSMRWRSAYNALFVIIFLAAVMSIIYILHDLISTKTRKSEFKIFAFHICASDVIHITTAVPVGLLKLNTNSFWKGTIPSCQILYPIYCLSSCNINFLFYLSVTYSIYKKRKMSETDPKIHHSLLLICWFIAFFLFIPQIFVEDLTQEQQTCDNPTIAAVVTIRSAYWIGTTYIQGLFIVGTLILQRMAQVEENNISTSTGNLSSNRSHSNSILRGHSDGKNMSQHVKSVMHGDRQNTPTFKEDTLQPVGGSFSSSKTSGTVGDSPRAERSRVCVRVTFSDDVLEKDDLQDEKKSALLKCISWMIGVQAVVIIPVHVFFYGYYYGNFLQIKYHFHLYVCATLCALLNSVINPFLLWHSKRLMIPQRKDQKETRQKQSRRTTSSDDSSLIMVPIYKQLNS